MKKIFFTILLFSFTILTYAQNTFPSSGNVGVGTVFPASTLHVQQGSTGYSWSPTAGTVGIFEGGDLSRAFLTIVGESTGQSELWFADEHRQNSGRIRYEHSNDALVFFTNGGADRLRIDREGLVGVGLSSPGSKLHVQDGPTGYSWSPIAGTVGIFEGGDSDRAFITILGKSNAQSELWFGDEERQNPGRIRYEHDRDALVFFTNGLANRMRIDKNGNVGIGTGTSSLTSKLAVKGDIHAEEVRVDLAVPAPDYVFEEDYDLPTLESLQDYVQENKHLPEVPSAAEMETDGIDLGVMNMLLLKKVEELTLHLIEQGEINNKQSEKLMTQNELIQQLQVRLEALEK
ncbi:MAG: tail fiber protein [Cytophagales bacterium]|nr:tail fiber protein [Cytophagales bacterium]